MQIVDVFSKWEMFITALTRTLIDLFFVYSQEFSLAEGYRFHVRDVIWYGTNTLNLRLRSCIQGSLHNHIYDIL